MASLRASQSLQTLARTLPRFAPRSFPYRHQRRWAQVHSVRFLATSQDASAVLDKYRSRLHQKASQEGHASIDDLKAAYADRILEQRRRDAIEPSETEQQAETPTPTPTPHASSSPQPTAASLNRRPSPSSSGSTSAVKPLGDLLDLEKVAALPEKELTAIWRLRHSASPQTLCAVIPAATYQAMERLARTSPQFVLPIPHPEQGAEMHFLQWTFDAASKTSTVLFTQLLEFKTRGEFAQPHTTVTHHLDLMGDKGVVLMQGQVVEGRGVQPEHAKWLLLCLQRFYGGWEGGEVDAQRRERAEERRLLLEWFTRGDSRFSVERLIEEAERMG